MADLEWQIEHVKVKNGWNRESLEKKWVLKPVFRG